MTGRDAEALGRRVRLRAAAASPTSRTPAGSPRSSTSRTTCSTTPTRSTHRVVDPYVDAYAAGARRTRASSATGTSSSGCCSTAPTRSGATCSRPVTTPAGCVTARGRVQLERAVDAAKDQSYVLAMLTAPQLERVRFPVGELTKADGPRARRPPRSAHRDEARQPGRVLHHPGRSRAVPRRSRSRLAPARSSTSPAPRSARTTASRGSRSGSDAGSGSRRASGASSSTSTRRRRR